MTSQENGLLLSLPRTRESAQKESSQKGKKVISKSRNGHKAWTVMGKSKGQRKKYRRVEVDCRGKEGLVKKEGVGGEGLQGTKGF